MLLSLWLLLRLPEQRFRTSPPGSRLVLSTSIADNSSYGIDIESQYRDAIVMPGDPLRLFFGGFVRIHILHHAANEAVWGVEMIEELKRHGYLVSPGTLYPILHQLEQAGYLTCEAEIVSGRRRKKYRITEVGRRVLVEARAKLRELVDEVLADGGRMAQTR
jgi:PadR family transcriptional regulator, regulatory protein PadR